MPINQTAKRLRSEGREVTHFGFGQSPFPVCPEVQEALKANSHRKEYLPTLGLVDLREAFCQSYEQTFGLKFSPDCVCIGPGSKELLFQSIFVLEGPLLIPAPSWVSYGPQAHIRGKPIHPILTQRENGYKLTGAELEETCIHLKQKQKILILNNPNNPTGSVYSEREMEELSEVCRKYRVVVLSDEIYALIDFTGKPSRSFATIYPEGTIVTSGLSKGHSAGGYRLGMLAAPDHYMPFIKCLAAMISETFSAVSAPIQYAAIEAYSEGAMRYATHCAKIHSAASDYLYQRLIKAGAGCAKPGGAFYLFPDFEDHREALQAREVHTGQELCDLLLNEYGVATLPASDFYCEETTLAFRMASVDYDGAKVYEASLKEALNDDFIEKHCPSLKRGCDQFESCFKA